MSAATSSRALVGEDVAALTPQHQHRARELRELPSMPSVRLRQLPGSRRGCRRGIAEAPPERVLPLPATVGPLAQVARQSLPATAALRPGRYSAIASAASSSDAKRVVALHELDDARATPVVFEAVADVDERDRRDPLWMQRREA